MTYGRDVLIFEHTFTLLHDNSGVLITPEHNLQASNFQKALQIAMLMHREYIFFLRCLGTSRDFLSVQGFNINWDSDTKRYMLDWREQLKADYIATSALFDRGTNITTNLKDKKALSGYVYLVQAITPDNHYKIGYSKEPVKRIESMGVKLPFPIEPLHTFETDDMILAEKALHDKYASKRVGGEWFELSEQDVADICAIDSLNAEDLAS